MFELYAAIARRAIVSRVAETYAAFSCQPGRYFRQAGGILSMFRVNSIGN